MRFTTSFLVAAASCISAVYAGLEDVKTGKHLNAQTFDSAIKGKASLVAFYAPWWVWRSVLRWPAALACCSFMRPGVACEHGGKTGPANVSCERTRLTLSAIFTVSPFRCGHCSELPQAASLTSPMTNRSDAQSKAADPASQLA